MDHEDAAYAVADAMTTILNDKVESICRSLFEYEPIDYSFETEELKAFRAWIKRAGLQRDIEFSILLRRVIKEAVASPIFAVFASHDGESVLAPGLENLRICVDGQPVAQFLHEIFEWY